MMFTYSDVPAPDAFYSLNRERKPDGDDDVWVEVSWAGKVWRGDPAAFCFVSAWSMH